MGAPHHPVRMVEVGVHLGELTEELLQSSNMIVFAVDPWEFADTNYNEGPAAKRLSHNSVAIENRALHVMEKLDRFRPRVAILPFPSSAAAGIFASYTLDLV